MRPSSSTFLVLALPLVLACATQVDAGPINNACGNAGTPPQLFGAEVDGPGTLDSNNDPPADWHPNAGRLSRSGIHYVSGNYVHLRLVTDRCTFINSVRFGSRILTTSGAAGYGYYAEAAVPQPKDPAQYTHSVWVQFANHLDGSTDEVTVWVGRTLGGGSTVQYRFTVVRVAAVEGRFVTAPIGISRDEVFNMFGRALYSKFNGATNSTVITSANGSTRRIYDYDPDSLNVTVTPTGVSFQFKFKAEVDHYCDPTMRVYGTFRLSSTFLGPISIEWVYPAQGSPSWPALCQAVQLIPFAGILADHIIEGEAGDASSSIRTALEEALGSVLPDTAGVPLAAITTQYDEVLMYVLRTQPSIRIQVPYEAFDLGRSATVFPSGQAITLAASGLGMNDYAAGVVPQTTLRSGPNGLPLAGTPTWPNPRMIERSGPLPWEGGPVARLLARTVPNPSPVPDPAVTYTYTPGCSVPASTHGPARILFGVNDTAADAERLRGNLLGGPGYRLRILFGEGGATCAADYEPPPPPSRQFD